MTTETNRAAAVLIAPQGTGGQLRGLVERLMNVGVQVTIVDEVAAAADLYHELVDPPALLVDLRDVGQELEDSRLATESLKRIKKELPSALPVPVLAMSTPAMLLACMRGGAGDVIDLKLEGTANAKTVVERVCAMQRDHATRHDLIEKQRVMIEDLLKDLIKTERRSIDVEEQLKGYAKISGTHPSLPEQRGPSILLVEHDRAVADELADKLESAGVATFAYVTGEEAVREAKTLAKGASGLDLVLVAAQLPGIDGLETIRRLRERIAHLPAFLMTSVLDADLAASAADLGVVGFVTKPLADLDEVVGRLAQLAKESLERSREQQYVSRIKERHERVLERYRSLPREP